MMSFLELRILKFLFSSTLWAQIIFWKSILVKLGIQINISFMVSNIDFLQKLMLTISIDGILEKHVKIPYHNIYSSDKVGKGPISSLATNSPNNCSRNSITFMIFGILNHSSGCSTPKAAIYKWYINLMFVESNQNLWKTHEQVLLLMKHIWHNTQYIISHHKIHHFLSISWP